MNSQIKSKLEELRIELYTQYQTFADEDELERKLEEENRNLRAHVHLASARLELRKLKRIEAKRAVIMQRQLRHMDDNLTEKTNKYKTMINQLKKENRELIEEVRLLQSQPFRPSSTTKKSKQRRNFILRFIPGRQRTTSISSAAA